MENPTTIAIDLSKGVFEVAVERGGRTCQRRRLNRRQLAAFLSERAGRKHVDSLQRPSPIFVTALRGGRKERMKGFRPARMPLYEAGFRRKPRP
jgi:hypothetical protein